MKIKDFLLKTCKLYKKYFFYLIFIYLLIFIRDNYISGSTDFWGVTVHIFILHIFGTALSCFLLKLWEEEKGQLKNFVVPFTQPSYRVKVWIVSVLSTASIMLVVFAAMSLLKIETGNIITQLIFSGGVYSFYKLFVSIVDQIAEIIIAVFMYHPQWSPFKTFFKGLEYNVLYLIPYCIFDFVLMIIPHKIVNLLKPHMDGIYIALIIAPLVGFTLITKAGFIFEIITSKEKKEKRNKIVNTYNDIDKLYKKTRNQSVLMVFVLFIFAMIISISVSFIVALLFILVAEIIIIFLILQKNVAKVDKILYDECDPVKYLDLIEYAVKGNKNFINKNLYRLLYSRLFTANIVVKNYDVVEQLLEKEKKNSANYKLYKPNYELVKAIDENNKEKYIYLYELAPESLKKLKPYECRYLIAQGKKQEAFELITSYKGENRYNEISRQKVLADYYISEGNIEEARKYMRFIADNANRLPVQKRAEKWLIDNGYASSVCDDVITEKDTEQATNFVETSICKGSVNAEQGETVYATPTPKDEKIVYTTKIKNKK